MSQSPLPYAVSMPGEIEADPEARNFAMFCHLAALSMYLTGVGIIVGPLIVWLIKKDKYPYVDRQGKEALNFNISFLVYHIAAALLLFVLVGFVLLPLVSLAWLVLLIVAAVKTNSGEQYRYPFIFRLI